MHQGTVSHIDLEISSIMTVKIKGLSVDPDVNCVYNRGPDTSDTRNVGTYFKSPCSHPIDSDTEVLGT